MRVQERRRRRMITSSRLLAIVGMLLLALMLSVCANATVVATFSDHLLGAGTIKDLLLNCNVDYDNGIYTYNYSLQYLTGTNTVTNMSVEDPDDVSYTEAWNSGNFINPTYNPEAWAYEVMWHDGTLTQGSTRLFSYKSVYGYREIPVSAYVSGGDTADGRTLGMSSSVPEPSSFAGLALAGFAAVPMLRRRRK
jgi:hypothetical protein